MSLTHLFSPVKLGALTLRNRIVMAPLTRCRAEADHVPGPLMADYYAQRAGAGLIIAEATMVMPGCSAFWTEPGIYSGAQIAGWRRVTEAVHAAGGLIALQLWHGGRACHPLMNGGRIPVAPSPLAIDNDEIHTPDGKKPHAVPRALADDEIPGIVDGFRQAAVNAKDAGFDAVEVHGANGYLLDEFLRDRANRREGGRYGGPIENRARLMLEVVEAVAGVWGADRTGLRISPLNSYNGMADSDPAGLTAWLAERLNATRLAYFHVMRGDFFKQQSGDVMTPARAFKGPLMANMGYGAAEADAAIASGAVDVVAFGVPFIANPDLPARFAAGAPLTPPDPATFYSGGAKGYSDWPALG